MTLALKSAGMRISRSTASKQTETTQRWKIALSVAGKSTVVNTKIEFSRRDTLEAAAVEPISAAIVQHHKMMPIVAAHYLLPAAVRQKVLALIGRREVQARDAFDLTVLFARSAGGVTALDPIRERIPEAMERTMQLTYEEYKGQVVAYLLPEGAEAYGSRDVWTTLQKQLLETLQKASP